MTILQLFIAIAVTVGIMLFIARSKRMRVKVFSCIAIFSCITGFIIYTLGYLPKDTGFADAMWAVLRGMFNMAGMFSVRENYDKLISSPNAAFLRDSALWQILFWLSHLLAASSAVYALIAAFGKKISNDFRVWLYTNLPLGKNKCHYIVILIKSAWVMQGGKIDSRSSTLV